MVCGVGEQGIFPRCRCLPERNPYSIVIPPPNVTGALHMGHALNNTLQDILCRWKRMSGYNVLWMPGTDHAASPPRTWWSGSWQREGKDRHALGREAFIERVWQWKAESGGQIIGQLKRLGASCDWERERFTMDEGLSTGRARGLRPLYEEGLIYRDNRLINWCPRCHTALSDIEVEHEEQGGPPLAPPLPGGRFGPVPRGRHHAARDHAGRHGGGREPGRRALQGPDRQTW